MENLRNPFLRSLFPDELNLIPSNVHSDSDGWILGDVMGNNSFFRSQYIQCSYQISGGYGPTPRYIYYALALLSVFGREQLWVVSAALGSVMVYSAAATIHAFVLVTMRTRLAPDVMVKNHEVVLVQGTSITGQEEPARENGPVWMPVLPMAWENDADPVLAIVGAAFLLLLPMQIWSKTLKRAKAEHKRVVLAWALLLFAGLIAALVNAAYVTLVAFPQVRFCPMDRADRSPLSNPDVDEGIEAWDNKDWYRWNRTVTKHFVDGNTTGPLATVCYYPCFGTSWPLRDSSEIYVVEGWYGAASDADVGIGLLFGVYLAVGMFTASSLTVASLSNISCIRANWRPLDVKSSLHNIRDTWCSGTLSVLGKSWRISLRLWIFYNLIVARFLSPLILTGFVVTMEWYMWTADLGGESFKHVGQWSVLVGAMLVLLVAAVPAVASLLRRLGFL